MRKLRKLVWVFVLMVMTGIVGGCSVTPQYYMDDTLGLGYVTRIAVLPFENHTQTKFVEERLRDIVTTEILSRGYFEVVEKGDVQRFFQEEVVSKRHETLDSATAQRLGRELKVDAYLAGSVDDYSEVRNGPYSYAVIAATFRLVDIKTGKIVWQTSGSESGYSTMGRIFGLASEDVNQISFKLVRRLLNTLQGE